MSYGHGLPAIMYCLRSFARALAEYFGIRQPRSVFCGLNTAGRRARAARTSSRFVILMFRDMVKGRVAGARESVYV